MIGDGFGEGFVCLDCREAPGVETVYFEDGPVMRDFSREACARCRSTVGGWRWWCFLDLELLDPHPALGVHAGEDCPYC